ncbi:MAG: hypothetical protein RR368_04075 [Oscillospiraceae bacterium]
MKNNKLKSPLAIALTAFIIVFFTALPTMIFGASDKSIFSGKLFFVSQGKQSEDRPTGAGTSRDLAKALFIERTYKSLYDAHPYGTNDSIETLKQHGILPADYVADNYDDDSIYNINLEPLTQKAIKILWESHNPVNPDSLLEKYKEYLELENLDDWQSTYFDDQRFETRASGCYSPSTTLYLSCTVTRYYDDDEMYSILLSAASLSKIDVAPLLTSFKTVQGTESSQN